MAIVDSTREALEELRELFHREKCDGDFLPRSIPPAEEGGEWRIVCVDSSGRIIAGVEVIFRPTITCSTAVPELTQPRA